MITLSNRSEFYLLNGTVPVYIINKLPSHIDIQAVIDTLEDNIPNQILKMIEGIYIGDFKELKNRNIQALFKDDAIYLSSFKDFDGVSEELIAKDICHELAHAVENNLGNEIYLDGKIENEYNGKKEKLYWMLVNDGYSFPKELLFSDNRVDELDEFLYQKVGYDKLSLMIPNLFTSPYSITSIREYFANGMEDFLLGDVDYLKHISPVLYKKLDELYNQFT